MSSAVHVEDLDVPVPASEQRKRIKQQIDDGKLALGEVWYLIDFRWWKLWKDFVQYDDDDNQSSTKPMKHNSTDASLALGRIDNSELLAGEEAAASPKSNKRPDVLKLKPNLQEDDDYVLLPSSVWRSLSEWYNGGPEISRVVIEEGKSKKLRVEVYPLLLKVSKSNSQGEPDSSTEFEVLASKKITIKELKTLICNQLSGCDPLKSRLWNLFGTSSKPILEENETLEQSRLVDGQRMMIEFQESNGSWIKETQNGNGNGKEKEKKKEKDRRKKFFGIFFSSSSSNNSSSSSSSNSNSNSNGSSSSSSSTSSSSGKSNSENDAYRGLCGLSNLGNTCFMNSALQCLSNTPPLTEYFMSGQYIREINRDNPLGMKGKIAEKYGDLIKHMWAGTHSSVSPQELKHTIGKFAPQFNGYSQHDSQEFLAFLLDGLHEDLNRILKKPYVEVKENGHLSEEQAAIEAWTNHLKRNQSIIVDQFQGQLKSTLVCPKCQHVSKCWDPFMYLSLPLPTEKNRNLEVTVVRCTKTWETPVKYAVTISKETGMVKNIASAVQGFVPDIDPKNILIGDVHNHRVHAYVADDRRISDIRSNDVTFAFETPDEEERKEKDLLRLQVVQRRERKKTTSGMSYHNPIELFGNPFLMYFAKGKTTGRELYEMMWNRVKGLVKEYSSTLPDGGENIKEFPFRLSVVSPQGLSCATCTSAMCHGCEIPLDDYIKLTRTGHTVAIDWDAKVTKKYLTSEVAEELVLHPSLEVMKPQPSNTKLMDCLKMFTMDEKLGANDPWYCPKCKEFHQANKKFDLWKTPSILVIHLKRFQYNKQFREKINHLVDFPLEGLDLSDLVQTTPEIPPIYDLFAVSNHLGGLHGGHYTAYAKNRNDNNWYLYNDSTCERTKSSQIRSQAAYVLFYRRRDP